MRILFFLGIVAFTTHIYSQEIEENTIDFSQYAQPLVNLLDLGKYKIIPNKRIQYEDFTIYADQNIIFNGVKEFDDSYELKVVAYDEANQPIPIDPDSVIVYYENREVDFEISNFFDNNKNNKKIIFDFLLDDSGSMAGEKINALQNVLESFFEILSDDPFLCRITWFSSSFDGGGNYLPCSDEDFRNIVIRGEYGGTYIYPALLDSYNKLDYMDDNQHDKAIFIISDGQDSSSDEEFLEISNLKNTRKIFVYLIQDGGSHRLEPIGDYFLSKETDFVTYLRSYLDSINNQLSHQNFIEISKRQLLSAEELAILKAKYKESKHKREIVETKIDEALQKVDRLFLTDTVKKLDEALFIDIRMALDQVWEDYYINGVSSLPLEEDFTEQEFLDHNNKLDSIEKESLNTIYEISEKARVEIEEKETEILKKTQAKKKIEDQLIAEEIIRQETYNEAKLEAEKQQLEEFKITQSKNKKILNLRALTIKKKNILTKKLAELDRLIDYYERTTSNQPEGKILRAHKKTLKRYYSVREKLLKEQEQLVF